MAGSPAGWTDVIPGAVPDGEWAPDPPAPTPEPEAPRVLRGTKGDKGDQGEVGPRGPRGLPGSRLEKLAVGPLAGGAVVRTVGDADHIDLASASVKEHARAILGVALTSAASAEELVEVVRLGELEDSEFNWIPGKNVYLGASGFLTQTIDPSWVFVRIIGIAMSATKIMVDPRPPVFLAH